MTDADRYRLAISVAGLMDPATRSQGRSELAAALKIESVLFFTEDSEIHGLLIAPGFPQSLPASPAWPVFLKRCQSEGQYSAVLPYPRLGMEKTVTGLACNPSGVLVLMGPKPGDDELHSLLPLLPALTATIGTEHSLMIHVTHAKMAQTLAREAATLAQGLDTARRAAQHEIRARIQADEDLRKARDELARTNADLEKRVEDRTQRLKETIAELETFSYSLSHDLRAPLRAVNSFTTLLNQECSGEISAVARDYLRRITTASVRMDKMIQDVLDFSRVAKTELKLTSVDVLPLLKGILETYPEFQERSHHVSIEAPLPRVTGNEAALTQCFSNLIGNALKFVEPGKEPRIRIRAESHGDRVRLMVQDNGLGIDPAYHEKIFGIFHKLNKSYEGTGIGLAIVRKVAERMGGTAGVNSLQGEGSTFWIDLKQG